MTTATSVRHITPIRSPASRHCEIGARDIARCPTHCSNCNLRELCMPLGLSPEELEQIDGLVASRRRVKRGAQLFRQGDAFTSLYAIRTGFFTSSTMREPPCITRP